MDSIVRKTSPKNFFNIIKTHKQMLISIFIISIPVLDLLTALDERLNILIIPIGTIIKLFFLIVAIIYSLIFSNKKERLLLLSVFLIYIIHAFINNIFASKDLFLDDTRLLFKYWSLFFFSIFVIIFIRKNSINKTSLLNSLSISLIIYSFFIIFPTIINTHFPSYYYSKEGSVGWYYAANEVGPIIILLIIFASYAMKALKPKPIYISSIIAGIISISLLGTKTALFSLFLFIIIQLFFFGIKRNKKLFIVNVIFLIITVLGTLLSSATSSSILQLFDRTLNTQQVSSLQMPNDITPQDYEQPSENKNIIFEKFDIIMSHRLTKTINILKENQDITTPQILFGKTYYYLNSEVITAEIDYVDFLLHFGIFGAAIFLCSVIYFIISTYKNSPSKTDLLYFTFVWLLLSIIAGLAGHVLTSPSVCIYLSASLMLFRKTAPSIKES